MMWLFHQNRKPSFSFFSKINPFSGALAGAPWMLMAAFMFSIMACFVRLSKGYLSHEEVVLYRSLPAVIVLAAIAVLTGKSLKTPFLWGQSVRGIIGTCSMLCNFYALSTVVPIGMTMTLSYTHPIFFVLISLLWYRQRVSNSVLLCVMIGFVGIMGISYGKGDLLTGASSLPIDGLITGLGAGFFAALAYINVRSLASKGEPEWRTVLYFSLFGVLVSLIWLAVDSLVFNNLHAFHNPFELHRLFLLAGLGGTGLVGQLLLMKAFRAGDMNVTGIFGYSSLIFSTLFGVFIFNEAIAFIPIIGMVLIGISGILMTWFKRRAV